MPNEEWGENHEHGFSVHCPVNPTPEQILEAIRGKFDEIKKVLVKPGGKITLFAHVTHATTQSK
jgi:hypothetical protein